MAQNFEDHLSNLGESELYDLCITLNDNVEDLQEQLNRYKEKYGEL